MKIIRFLGLAMLMLSCMQKNLLRSDKISSVHPVFQDTTARHWQGYHVNGKTIPFDVRNGAVKDYLSENLKNIGSFEKANDISQIVGKIENSKTHKYLPIKVIPLDEFGYLQLTDNKIISYAIMGGSAFIDLTHNRVYMK